MLNFQSIISFSSNISQKRIHQANQLLGEKTVKRIVAVALFLLGGKRESIGLFLDIPVGTVFSLLTRFQKNGIKAFIHQKKKQFIEPMTIDSNNADDKNRHTQIEIVFGDQKESLTIPLGTHKITINSSNQVQFKTLIITLLNSGFITLKKASEILNLSDRHLRTLNIMLQQGDVTSLIDKRQETGLKNISKKIHHFLIVQLALQALVVY